MKVIIQNIELNPVEITNLGDKELNFINGEIEVSYLLVNGYNKLDGKIKIRNRIDSIQQIAAYVLAECQESFGSGGAKCIL